MKLLEIVKNNLIKNRFNAKIFGNIIEAKEYIVKTIGSNKKIGIGGSVSFRESAILDEISKNNQIFTHQANMNQEERRKIWLISMDCDFYLASPQAVTIDGKLIFIDGTGNRCAAITWGPRHIILLAGINKIVKNQDIGLWRARNIAAIRNNIRLSKKNPCVEKGECVDCSSEDRICNIVTILWKRPKITDISVVLINEDIGY
ncbi:MAG: lactate utilization protein [Elusimicrobiales bacterium]|nr:lactate utilization protein [Elusimicrobiales bacterium]